MKTRIFVYLSIFIFGIQILNSQNDLPNPVANIQLIKAGSLIIAMDNDNQAIPGYFNMKAYGLINEFLQNDVPVRWAIRAGKAKNEIDFSAMAQRISPSILPQDLYSFRGGPFIVDSTYSTFATYLINNYGQNVAVYELINDTYIDIRYYINHKPRMAVLNNGGYASIHNNVLAEAGIDPMYIDNIPASQIFDPNECYSFASEPHWGHGSPDTAQVNAIYRFVKLGGNFLAQCDGLLTYENADTLHTTHGIVKDNNNRQSYEYVNADMPFLQIHGPLAATGGSVRSWSAPPGSTFRPNTYSVVQDQSNSNRKSASVHKSIDNSLAGGNVFYLGGHDYGTNTSNDLINGRRLFMNAVLSPSFRLDSCLQMVSLLPVNLSDFRGTYINDVIELNWQTSVEVNNAEFIIEKRDGSGKFIPIASVRGAGNSNEVIRYSVIDPHPQSGINYYRIKQVNFDGSSSYPANVIHVQAAKSRTEISVYPNPVQGNGIFITLSNQNDNFVGFSLNSINGNQIFHGRISVDQMQSQTIYFEFPVQPAPGIYILTLDNKEERVNHRVVIQ